MYVLGIYISPFMMDFPRILSGSGRYARKTHIGQKPDMVVLKNHPPKTYCQQKRSIIRSMQHVGKR